MTINELMDDFLEYAIKAGFEDPVAYRPDKERIALKLMLIVSELAEALEAVRNSKSDNGNLGEELADAAIRLILLARTLDIDLENEITSKMTKNWLRPYKHGGKAF